MTSEFEIIIIISNIKVFLVLSISGGIVFYKDAFLGEHIDSVV